MKLNNQGWGLREMLFLIAILVFFFCLSIYFIYILHSSISIKTYSDSEDNIVVNENNNWWKLGDILKKFKAAYVVWAVMLFIIIGLLTYLGILNQRRLEPYKKLEKELINYTEKYVELEFLYPEEGESIKVTTDQLKKNGILKDFSYKDDKCSGYVVMSFNGVYNYKAYIKCDNYETKGY